MRTVVVTAICFLMLLWPASVTADTERGHWGRTGRHHLRDTRPSPGGRCVYDVIDLGDEVAVMIDDVVARPPVAFARRSGDGTQVIGWRARVRALFDDHWKTVELGPIQKRIASGTEAAHFRRQRFDVSRYADRVSFRVLVDVFWYAHDGRRIVGGATHAVDFHAAVDHRGRRLTDTGSTCMGGFQ